jgi:hypothetical protein
MDELQELRDRLMSQMRDFNAGKITLAQVRAQIALARAELKALKRAIREGTSSPRETK